MEVSFIIPFCHDNELLKKTIKSIQDQVTSYQYEIILVDNRKINYQLNMPGAKVLWCERKGAACARNLGAKYAKGKYLAFIDADVELDNDWLQLTIEELLKFPNLAAVQTPTLTSFLRMDKPSFIDRYRFAYKNEVTNGTFLFLTETNLVLNTAACLVKKEFFSSVGGFEEKLLRSEDSHFTFKLLARGHFISTVMSTKARVYNEKNLWGFALKYYQQGIDDRRLNEAIGIKGYSPLPPYKGNEFIFRRYRNFCRLLHWIGGQKKSDPLEKISFSPSLLNPMLGLSPEARLIRGSEGLIVFHIYSGEMMSIKLEEFHWQFPLRLSAKILSELAKRKLITSA